MENAALSRAIWRGLTTVNAPLPLHIDADTLLACLLLKSTDRQWQPHVRAFFQEVGVEVIMDMVVEGSVTFDSLSKAIRFWNGLTLRAVESVTPEDDPARHGHLAEARLLQSISDIA
jgi:hypothetical protein